jgi:hypothetical protein
MRWLAEVVRSHSMPVGVWNKEDGKTTFVLHK